MNHLFLVEIVFLSDAWFIKEPDNSAIYKKGERILVPMLAKTPRQAKDKFVKVFAGSEFPKYNIIDAKEFSCDKFLFKPDFN